MSVWGHVTGIINVDNYDYSLDATDRSPTRLRDNHPISDKKVPVSLGRITDKRLSGLYNNVFTKLNKEEEEARYRRLEQNWKDVEADGMLRGSEGSIEWDWHPYLNQRRSGDGNGYYTIYGNLRDFESVEPVKKWLDKITKLLNNDKLSISSGMVQASISNDESSIYQFVFEEACKAHPARWICYKLNNTTKILFGENQ